MASDVTAIVSGIRGVAIFPRVVYNSSLDVNLYFKDTAGSYQAWSGSASYTPSIKIRRSKGFNSASPRKGACSIDISDGATTRTIYFDADNATYTDWGSGNYQGTHGLLGGFNGAVVGNRWVFNGGSGGVGVSAAAVWAGTRVSAIYASTVTSGIQSGTMIIEADSVGNQAALSFSNNTLYPAHDAQVDVLKQGSATEREMVLLRITPAAAVTVSSFSQITSGWSCTVPFTHEDFIRLSNDAAATVSEYQDYDVEIVVTKNSDSSVTAVVVGKVRVYRKQISLVL